MACVRLYDQTVGAAVAGTTNCTSAVPPGGYVSVQFAPKFKLPQALHRFLVQASNSDDHFAATTVWYATVEVNW
jgi:hypothetical protein